MVAANMLTCWIESVRDDDLCDDGLYAAAHIVAGGSGFVEQAAEAADQWAYYLAQWSKQVWPELDAIRHFVVAHGLQLLQAEHFCDDYGFRLSSGSVWCFTWRGFGDLMAAIRGLHGTMPYLRNYMNADPPVPFPVGEEHAR